MILNYNRINNFINYEMQDNPSYKYYDSEEEIRFDILRKIINKRIMDFGFDYKYEKITSITIEADNLEELKEHYSELVSIATFYKEHYGDRFNVNVSINIDNNFRINESNYKDIVMLKESLEEDNLDFVFSEKIDFFESEWSLEEVISANNKIEKLVDKINESRLSPLEKIAVAYNLIANIKVYNEEGKESSKDLSRSIYALFNNDHIVCLGYAQLFEAIVNRLGEDVKAYTNFVDLEDGRHANNFVYIKDEKYGINGYYLFDITKDARNFENVCYNFSNFMIPLSAISKFKEDAHYDNNYIYSDNGVSVGKEGFSSYSIEVLQRGQKGIDSDIENVDVSELETYLYNKSKPLDRSKVVDLFMSAFPSLNSTQLKIMFSSNECIADSLFASNAFEVMFCNASYENEVDQKLNKLKR